MLLTRRPAGEWHLHGGKVEPGETEAAAVRRETLEEVDVAVADADLFCLSRLWVDLGGGTSSSSVTALVPSPVHAAPGRKQYMYMCGKCGKPRKGCGCKNRSSRLS